MRDGPNPDHDQVGFTLAGYTSRRVLEWSRESGHMTSALISPQPTAFCTLAVFVATEPVASRGQASDNEASE